MRPFSVVLVASMCVASLQAFDRVPIGRLRAHAVVPSREFATIQAAIDAVEDGGSIVVKPGIYREQVTIEGKRVRLTGSGADGPRRTELVGAPSTMVDEHLRAVGVVNYLDGGGGVIEGIALRGGVNGIVGGGADAVRDEPAADLAHALTVRDVVITNTGRGILWHAPGNLTIHDMRARRLRHNGVVFAPHGGAGRAGPALKILNAEISQAGGYGVLIIDTPSIGCQNQLSNVHVTLAALGGIGVIRSGVCISAGALSLNRVSGIYLQQSAVMIDGTSIQSSMTTSAGYWGDGIISMGSELTLSNALLNLNARAGVSNFGGLATLSWNTFNCHGFDLDGEDLPAGYFGPSQPPADAPSKFHDAVPGSNTCGCGAVQESCVTQSSQLQPPAPVVVEQ